MTYKFDENGKFFTEIISKKTVTALVQTSTHLIRGTVHTRKEERIKDELERDELFLAITDAHVLGTDGATIHQTDFIAVRRSQIIWVIPDEKDESQDGMQ